MDRRLETFLAVCQTMNYRRAADALLQFASSLEAGETIRSMTAGYRMQMDSSRRLQLIPTWKIVTDRTNYFMDCDKKTLVTI